MVAVSRALAIEQGATFTLGFNWMKPNETNPDQPGDPHDLTDWTALMQVRKAPGQPLQLEASTANGKIVIGGETGRVDIELTPEDTRLLQGKTAQYDLELTAPNGDVYRLLRGLVTIYPELTL